MDSVREALNVPPQSSVASPNITASKCRLLALPAELRNRIYEYAIYAVCCHYEGRVHIETRFRTSQYRKKPPKLLESCHQIRKEALPIYLQCSTFVFHQTDGRPVLFGWFEQHLKHMRSIELRSEATSAFYKLNMQDGLENYVLEKHDVNSATRESTIADSRTTERLKAHIAADKAEGKKPMLNRNRLCELLVVLIWHEPKTQKYRVIKS